MKKHIPHTKITHIITLAAITGLFVFTGNSVQAQTTDDLDQTVFPTVTAQPVDQVVPIGSDVVLSVQANNADGYQWLRNGVPVDGQINNSLTIQNAGTNDVGLYSCNVFNGAEAVPTRAANVCVYMTGSNVGAANAGVVATRSSAVMAKSSMVASSSVGAARVTGGGPITVFGTPYPGGGSKGGCPGTYAGYVIYTKTVSQGWGWSPTGTVHTASDGTGRTDTKVEYGGAYGDYGCNQTSVSVNPTYSPVYRFTIYFPSNIPTNAYPITLTGFNL
jgi:hypothetical protein